MNLHRKTHCFRFSVTGYDEQFGITKFRVIYPKYTRPKRAQLVRGFGTNSVNISIQIRNFKTAYIYESTGDQMTLILPHTEAESLGRGYRLP